MKNVLLFISLGLFLSSSLFAQQSIDEILMEHNLAQANELEIYLKANPKAEDWEKAVSHLVSVDYKTGNTGRQISWLKQRYDRRTGTEQVDVRKVVYTTRELVPLMLKMCDKEGARKVLDMTRKIDTDNVYADKYQELANTIKRPVVGDIMEMKFTSFRGKEVDLAAMKGKVVFISFWDLWSGHSGAELPYMSKAYDKYHSKGFDIITVVIDKHNRKSALEARIKHKELPWPHYYDGKGWGGTGIGWLNKYAAMYQVGRAAWLPATFLIGPDGTVVATDLRGDDIEKTVSQYFAK